MNQHEAKRDDACRHQWIDLGRGLIGRTHQALHHLPTELRGRRQVRHPRGPLATIGEVVLLVPERCRHIEGVRDGRVLQAHQVVLRQQLALMSLAKQLDETPGLVFRRRLSLDGERILGLVQVGPVERPVHHDRGQRLDEYFCPAEDVMRQELSDERGPLNRSAVREIAQTIELDAPFRISLA
ncbi:hypothetical protein D9M70_475990 [compost metagenome]